MQNLVNPHLCVYTNFYLEFFIIVVNFVSITGKLIFQLSSIKIELNRDWSLLKIKLRRPCVPKTAAVSNAFHRPIRISIDDFLDYVSHQILQKIEISSRGFDWNNLLNLGFLFSLLFYMNSNTEFKLAIKDEVSMFIHPLPALLYAALHDPQRLLRVSLNLFYCRFNQEDVIKILKLVFCEAIRLKKLKFIVNGEGISLAKIMEGVMDSGITLAETLEKLVLDGRNFDGSKAIIERIFGSYRMLEHLKIWVNQIDWNDGTLQVLTENEALIAKLKTLHLLLRNKQITNASIEDFFRVLFNNLEDLKIDFQGSDVNNKGLIPFVKTRFRKLPQIKILKFDFDGTIVSMALRDFLEYLRKKKLEGGQNEDNESSFRMIVDTFEESE